VVVDARGNFARRLDATQIDRAIGAGSVSRGGAGRCGPVYGRQREDNMIHASRLHRRTCLGFALGLVTDLAIPHGLDEPDASGEEAASGDLPRLNYRVVHHFTDEEGTERPSGIVLASDGRGYGTNTSGGEFGRGTVFSINGAKQVRVLHAFRGKPHDGSGPESSLVEADDGALYGTTPAGGSANFGVAYRLAHGGMTILHEFGVTPGDGQYVSGGLIFASDAQFYGVASRGGAHDLGMVFRMDKAGNVTPVWQFGDSRNDPAWPGAPVREGADGRLYGTAFGPYAGVIYSVAKDGSDPRVLHLFKDDVEGAPGATPMTIGSDGRIYGVNDYGAPGSWGRVYELHPDDSVTVLYTFDGSDGDFPNEVLEYKPGVLIGTTLTGGSSKPDSDGVVYMLHRDGRFRTLHTFSYTQRHRGERELCEPAGALLLGPGGQVTGTCGAGGRYGNGGIFTLVPVSA